MKTSRLLAVVALAGGVMASGLATVPSATAQAGCTDFVAVAAADGVRVLGQAPGLSPTDVDGAGPAAQAQVDSNGVSMGYAGAPFSEAVAGNAGAANVDATRVPVFAMSSYPSTPTAGTSSANFTLQSTSDALSSASKAEGGASTAPDPSVGRTTTTASAACGSDGAVNAVGDNLVEAGSFAGGVLRIGAVHSNAKAAISSTGERTLTGTIAVEGATVLGQAVSITDQGLVTGQAPTPLPADPLARALSDAGISVRTIAAVKDDQDGDVLAPALEVKVTREVSGFGTGPSVTTYTFGRAYARAGAAPAAAVATPATSNVVPPLTPATGGSSSSSPSVGASNGSIAPSGSPDPAAPVPASAVSRAGDVAMATPIANASLASIYPALVVGAAVLLAAWLVFRAMGVKRRWT